MPTNNRVFYATQLIHLNPQNTDGTAASSQNYTPRSVQSVGITTNFNLTEVFSVGQLEVYDQPEDLPEIEVTMNKVLDGTPLLYHLCLAGASADASSLAGAINKSLTEIGNNRVNFSLGVFADTNTAATGTPDSFVTCSGMYLSSFTYTFGVDDNFTEDITLVGNSKIWSTGDRTGFTDFHAGTSTGSAGNLFNTVFGGDGRSSQHTARRMNIDYANSTFPEGSGGINRPGSSKGYNNAAGTDGDKPYYQSITLSSDLGREEIRQLGQFDPYYRYITFPTEVTSEFEVVASEGDFLDASDFAGEDACTSSFTQLAEKQIKIRVCSAAGTNTRLDFDLGTKNKITSVNYGGGDAGGDNVTVSYSFRNFNSFKIDANGDYANPAFNINASADTPPAN